jgi:hypothetical protein
MPLQNRVDPTGTIFACAERGTFMGNRGKVLHDENRRLVRQYASDPRWITCLLEYKGVKRTLMSPRQYTELFFLDEAVAFSAGHRPCALCRRDRYNAFLDAWIGENPRPTKPKNEEIDRELEKARLDKRTGKITYKAAADSLPNGCFVELNAAYHLVWNGHLYQWSPGAYASKRPMPSGLSVTVLTPQPFVRCFTQGYKPAIHPSASAL